MATERRFDKVGVRRWRRDIFREIRSSGIEPNEPAFSVGMVLSAVYGFGTDTGVIAELTGLHEDYVKSVLKKLRKARVLRGQTLRVRWNADGFEGTLAFVLDAHVAAGNFTRGVDEKRSAAQRARRRPEMVKPRKPRAVQPKGAVFTPGVTKSNPLYGLPEWESETKRDAVDPHADSTGKPSPRATSSSLIPRSLDNE